VNQILFYPMSPSRNNFISEYFQDLNPNQVLQFEKLGFLYPEWNARINVISRRDIDHLFLHHIIHSLSIAKVIRFKPGTAVMDAGTGGGFPGIPLAILFPDTHFTLVDSIAKKIKVVEAITADLELKNVSSLCVRFEEIRDVFDFVTGRAVSDLTSFLPMVRKNIREKNRNEIPNGILYLKGGELEAEISSLPGKATVYDLSKYFSEDFFLTKKLIHLHNF